MTRESMRKLKAEIHKELVDFIERAENLKLAYKLILMMKWMSYGCM